MSIAPVELTNLPRAVWDPSAEDPMYPSNDGKPMADHTEQFDWIVAIKEGLEYHFRGDPDVFVAGNLLWYPVEGQPTIRVAPDAMLAFGRPKGPRSCYKQWQEAGIAPQVVVEVRSPGNRAGAMMRKLAFYELYGAEEYYDYDPFRGKLRGWLRDGDRLVPIAEMIGWVSPRLGIEFGLAGKDLVLTDRNGNRLLTPHQLYGVLDEQSARIVSERARAEAERERADAERSRADEQSQRAARLAEKLRALGIDPDA